MRIEKVLPLLEGIDALLVTDPVDLFYLTGLELSAGVLLLSADPKLFVDGRYLAYCEAEMEIPVLPKEEFELGDLRVGFERDLTPYSLFESWKQWNLVPVDPVVRRVRQTKEPEEIASLKRAAVLAVRGHEHLLSCLQPGVTERELAAELQRFWFAHGGEGASFAPIVAFGENSAFPHHHPSDRKLRAGELVLLDLGVQLERYQSDMTRVEGSSPLVEIVEEAQSRALALCRPGVRMGDLDIVTQEYLQECGYSCPHSLGHGVGLEVHEMPRIRKDNDELLQENMVITIEPGVYLPGQEGVRLEETICITADGYDVLTQSR